MIQPAHYRWDSEVTIHAIYSQPELAAIPDEIAFLRWSHIDASTYRTDEDFLAELARVMEFKDYFGHNWDAAIDCLRDLPDVTPLTGHGLIVTGAMEGLRRTAVGTLVEAWQTASAFSRQLGVGLHLVLYFGAEADGSAAEARE